MDILGIGPLELFFILLIALIVLGPKDMVKAGRTIGRVLRSVVKSPNWRMLQQTSREIRSLPNRLMREAGIEELQNSLPDTNTIGREIGLNDVKKDIHSIKSDISEWTTPPTSTETSQESLIPDQNPPTTDPLEQPEYSIESSIDQEPD